MLLQENGILPDLHNDHEHVPQLQEQENKLLNKHKSLLEAGQKWLEKDKQLLNMTENVDDNYDGNRAQNTC